MNAEALAQQLSGGAAAERLAAAEALAVAGDDAAPAAAALVEACVDASLREICVGALEELGPPPSEQMTAIAELVRSENESVAYWAATLLGRAGPDAAPHAATLAETAEVGPAAAAERAVWALGKIGPGASSAMPVLERIAGGEAPRIARLAAEAISQIWAKQG